MASAAEQLASVQAAIAKIEAGAQTYTVQGAEGGVTYTRADLSTLYKREERLLQLAARDDRGGIRLQRGVPR